VLGGTERLVIYFSYYSNILMAELKKMTEPSVKVVGISAEI
jgi:hypothetical protein